MAHEQQPEPKPRARPLLHQVSERASNHLEATIKSMFLINGGALVAIIALIGAVAKDGGIIPPSIADVMISFIYGLIASTGASFFAYFAIDTAESATPPTYLSDSAFATVTGAGFGLMLLCMGASLYFAISGSIDSTDAVRQIAEASRTRNAESLQAAVGG